MYRVFVIWDPLLEKVICVHESEDIQCEKCKEILERAKKDGAYYPEGDWFEVNN
jgi:hypothetical protein